MKNKFSLKIVIILSFLCIVFFSSSIYLLIIKKDNSIELEKYINLFETMSLITEENINECIGGEYKEGYYKNSIDSINYYLNLISFLDTNQEVYFNHITNFYSVEKEQMKKILNSYNTYNEDEKLFLIKWLKYISLQRMYEERLLAYFPFDRVKINQQYPLKGDTIRLGEIYSVAIPFCCFNSRFQPFLILDGDTLELEKDNSLNIFSEKTTKRGNIKREGFIIYGKYGNQYRKFPLKIEYYVK
ncbi:MAG TPA: hypothetical protein PLF32_00190 [Bacteroidales bacterium]|nr:hypothetical protein [Bacteroidales bacterium]HPJ91113.1 hypothetical protein [Bacteroidales bacterium]